MAHNAKNIKEILENDVYVIPRYQRNYAWGKAEISQLIKDIEEFFPKENNQNKSYYLIPISVSVEFVTLCSFI